jgi:hypothetical protein
MKRCDVKAVIRAIFDEELEKIREIMHYNHMKTKMNTEYEM